MLERFKLSQRVKFPALAQWELTECISAGEWSTVFRARPTTASANEQSDSDSQLNAKPDRGDYVIKMASKRAKGDLPKKLLQRESLIARSVSHSNLVPVLDCHLDSDQPFVVQPFLHGTSLQSIVEARAKQKTSIGPAYSLWIIRQVSDALTALHDQSIVHCDLAPRNVMLSANGHATLIDLGLAQIPKHDRMPAHHLAGTIDYLAPEQLDAKPILTQAVDIYALGGLAYQLLTGELATRHEDRSPEYRLLTQTLGQRSCAIPAVDKVSDLLLAMLSHDIGERPKAQEVSRQLIRNEINTFAARAA